MYIHFVYIIYLELFSYLLFCRLYVRVGYSVLCQSAVLAIICENWHLTYMWKALACPHHHIKREGLGPYKLFYPLPRHIHTFLEMPAPSLESVLDVSIWPLIDFSVEFFNVPTMKYFFFFFFFMFVIQALHQKM